jgi:hypothetical protein
MTCVEEREAYASRSSGKIVLVDDADEFALHLHLCGILLPLAGLELDVRVAERALQVRLDFVDVFLVQGGAPAVSGRDPSLDRWQGKLERAEFSNLTAEIAEIRRDIEAVAGASA